MGEIGTASSLMQLIDGDGIFNVVGLDNASKKLSACGVNYAVVSIIGPQSSGKSTLLNHLFGTSFKEMNASLGRSQTTKGIWYAICTDIEPCTLVVDVEGTDGVERGQNDLAFEKQSALFALSASDVVLINMWCHDIGRENGGNVPLLRIVFEVMMKLFRPRRTTLLFIIRDMSAKTPLERLETALLTGMQKIYDSVSKPEAYKETPLSAFFDIQVIALPNYEEKEELFKEQVAALRLRFINSTSSGGLAENKGDKVPASEFSFSAQLMWEAIKENKDLDLPAHKVLVATIRCENIVKEKFANFTGNEEWCQLSENVQLNPISGLGKKVSSMIDSCISEYDAEAKYFDESVREEKRKFLQDKLLQIVKPAYEAMLQHLLSGSLNGFKKAFDKDIGEGKSFTLAVSDLSTVFLSDFAEGCADAAVTQADWNSSKAYDKLQRDISAYVASIRASKLSQLTFSYEDKLNVALSNRVVALLDEARDNAWPIIRNLLLCETELVVSSFSKDISGFNIEKTSLNDMLTSIELHGRSVVEAKAKEAAGRVSIAMKDRFLNVFSHGSDSMPRIWIGTENIGAITKSSRTASLKLLSVLAAIRLGNNDDDITNILSVHLLDANITGDSPSFDLLGSSTWEQVSTEDTLITPMQCISLWKQLLSEVECIISQTIASRITSIQNKLNMALSGPVEALLVEASENSWPLIRELFLREMDAVVCSFSKDTSGCNIEKTIMDDMLASIERHGRNIVEEKARQAADGVLIAMKDRFLTLFNQKSDSTSRTWTGTENIGAIAKSSLAASLELLSVLCVTQLDNDDLDITKSLSVAFMESAGTSDTDSVFLKFVESTWEQVSSEKTLITYTQCVSLWRQFTSEVQYIIHQACTIRIAVIQEKLTIALSEPVEILLAQATDNTWSTIRDMLIRETKSALSSFSKDISGCPIEKMTLDNMLASIERHGRSVVENKARQAAERVLISMKGRFSNAFCNVSKSMPRIWNGSEDIEEITRSSRSESIRLLSVLVAIRLSNDVDDIGNILSTSLLDFTGITFTDASTSSNPLASNTWEQVSSMDTLITPIECSKLWTQFISEVEYIITQATAAQTKAKIANDEAIAKASKEAAENAVTKAKLEAAEKALLEARALAPAVQPAAGINPAADAIFDAVSFLGPFGALTSLIGRQIFRRQ